MQSSEVREVEERSAPGRMRWSTSVSISYDVLQTCCRTGVPMKEYCQNAAEAGVSEVHLVSLFRSEPSVANPDETRSRDTSHAIPRSCEDKRVLR